MEEKIIDQELEDAANNWIDLHYNKGVEYSKSKRGAANPKSGFIAGAAWQKEQSFIPTDEEILNKCLEHSNNLYNSDDKCKDNILSEYQLWENCLRDYEVGYKQALKDLGYADN